MKLTNCPRCGGKLRCDSIGWKCEKCKGFIDMQGNFHEHTEKPFMPPMTNADRIQEKLAETLSGMCKIAEQCDDCPMEGNCPGGSYDLSVWSKWLQQPAKGE